MTDKTFTFEHNGEELSFEKPFSEVRTPKFLRANRKLDELDMVFTILEAIAGDDVLEAIDEMGEEDFAEFTRKVFKAMETDSQATSAKLAASKK
ncbi:hypothetical protein [Streptomyces sp. NPDC005385]|uniref:hypothetical protein n=1 Tax=Streptomyces sp. NPDC005385 TaxID=3157039 RepID=UPI0033B989B6